MEAGVGGGGAGEAASLVFLLEVFLINQAGQLFELFSPDS
jgi:4-diphosphocytidyl-2C-methyl-D-erythritol kinase